MQAVTVPLRGRTVFITGASRGIGKAIAIRLAADGAAVVVTGKTVETHRTLPGTIYTAAEEIRSAGGSALAVPMDVRDEAQVETAVNRAIDEFGRIDVLVNNASAISLTGTAMTPMKRFDLMHQVNVRGTFLCTQKCLPHLKRGVGAHVLNIAPPLNFEPCWFAPHAAYSISKYGTRTIIDTAALALVPGVDRARARTPVIMADAAYEILTRDPTTCTGRFFVDEDILREVGVTDFSRYRTDPSSPEEPLDDFFL